MILVIPGTDAEHNRIIIWIIRKAISRLVSDRPQHVEAAIVIRLKGIAFSCGDTRSGPRNVVLSR